MYLQISFFVHAAGVGTVVGTVVGIVVGRAYEQHARQQLKSKRAVEKEPAAMIYITEYVLLA